MRQVLMLATQKGYQSDRLSIFGVSGDVFGWKVSEETNDAILRLAFPCLVRLTQERFTIVPLCA